MYFSFGKVIWSYMDLEREQGGVYGRAWRKEMEGKMM